jgi:hypothetical protein
VTRDSIVAAAVQTEDMFHSSALTPVLAPTIRRLAGLAPRTIAVMHGSCFSGDGATELNGLAAYYARALDAALSPSA